MREILFRGKRKAGGELVEGFYVALQLVHYDRKEYLITDKDTGRSYEVDPATVGQYTGLADMNGKRIFEGDILRWIGPDGESGKVIVVYFGGAFMLKSVECPKADPDLFADFEIGDQMLDIIGNIHDNPELLGGALDSLFPHLRNEVSIRPIS